MDRSPERKVHDLSFHLAFEAAFGYEQEILDGSSDRDRRPDLDDAGHGLIFPHALIGVMRYGRHIVSEEDSPLSRGPFEHLRIVGTRQANVLDTDDVHL